MRAALPRALGKIARGSRESANPRMRALTCTALWELWEKLRESVYIEIESHSNTTQWGPRQKSAEIAATAYAQKSNCAQTRGCPPPNVYRRYGPVATPLRLYRRDDPVATPPSCGSTASRQQWQHCNLLHQWQQCKLYRWQKF